MKKKQCKKLHKTFVCADNCGSAMITALIVSVVVIMFCLTALAVSYSLFASSSKKVTQDQCRELAKSVSLEIQDELENTGYSSEAAQQAALASGEDMLWQYLRYNVCQANWPYYQEDDDGNAVTGHNEAAAYRYFKMNATGGKEGEYAAFTDDISVCIYWENSAGDAYASNESKTKLYVKVTCTRGNESATMVTKYALSCTEYGSETGDEDITVDTEKLEENRSLINPKNNTIDSDSWTWEYVERS